MRIEAHVAVCERATTARHVEVKPPAQIPWRSRVMAAVTGCASAATATTRRQRTSTDRSSITFSQEHTLATDWALGPRSDRSRHGAPHTDFACLESRKLLTGCLQRLAAKISSNAPPAATPAPSKSRLFSRHRQIRRVRIDVCRSVATTKANEYNILQIRPVTVVSWRVIC